MKLYSYCLLFFLYITNIYAHKPRLYDYALDVYSQHGEDGIIKKIFEIMGTTNKVAVEFGAWDGFYLSNTANLWVNDPSWRAILIEGDEKKFHELVGNVSAYPCIPIKAWVGIEPENRLETILQNRGIFEVDLLSIDIDGNDYYIFEGLTVIRPRLIICEHNPTIPVTLDVYAEYSATNNFGCSAGALNRLAQKKGYALIALTATNAFFIPQEEFHKFAAFETELPLLDVNDFYITLVTTYDGKFALINKQNCSIYGIGEPYKGNLQGNCSRFCTAGLPRLS